MVEFSKKANEVLFTDIPATQFDEMMTWANASGLTIKDYHITIYHHNNNGLTGVFIFTNEKDAMLFKIRWMSEV